MRAFRRYGGIGQRPSNASDSKGTPRLPARGPFYVAEGSAATIVAAAVAAAIVVAAAPAIAATAAIIVIAAAAAPTVVVAATATDAAAATAVTTAAAAAQDDDQDDDPAAATAKTVVVPHKTNTSYEMKGVGNASVHHMRNGERGARGGGGNLSVRRPRPAPPG